MTSSGLKDLRSHVKDLHKDRSKACGLILKPLDRVQARLSFEKERDLWWRHAEAEAEAASPTKLHAGFNLKQIERELTLTEEREWMKKHKKARPHEFTIAEKKILREWFDLLDADASGTVSTDELQEMLLTLGLAFTTDDSMKIIRSIDVDGSGCVDFEEFVVALTPQHGRAHARLEDLEQSNSFTGLKKCMKDQSQGLLDAKTHVSIERRRFLVSAIMDTADADDAGAADAGDNRKRRKRKSKLPANTKLRLHGLEHAITRNARNRIAGKSNPPPSDPTAKQRQSELQAAANGEAQRRLEARQYLRHLACVSEAAKHDDEPAIKVQLRPATSQIDLTRTTLPPI